MRKIAWMGLVGLVVLLVAASPALASHFRHHGVRTSFGFHFFFPFYSPAYVAPYPYYPYYYQPPVSYYPSPPPAPQEVGYLRLDVFPSDAHVYLDGRYLGPVQQFPGGAVAIPPGAHQVAVVAWGHRPFQSEVQIAPGQTSTVSLVLDRDPNAPTGPPTAPGGPQGFEGGPRGEPRSY